MPDLSDKAIEAWFAKLPPDIRDAISGEDENASTGSGGLIQALDSAEPQDVPEILRAHPDDLKSFGRPRRIRIAAWLAKTSPNPARVFLKMTGEEDSDGSSGEGVGIMFLEDIVAFAKAIGVRQARITTNAATMDAVVQAAFAMESEAEFTMKQGGM